MRSMHWTGLGLTALCLLSAAACSRSVPQEAPPPPPAMKEAPPPVLAGGPAPEAHRPGWGTMAPIPNPSDMSAAERARVYGMKGHGGRMGARAMPTERVINGHIVVAMQPIPNPPARRWGRYSGYHAHAWTHARHWGARQAWVAPAHAAAPAVHAAPAYKPAKPAPAPMHVAPPKPLAAAKPAPLPVPAAVTPPKPAAAPVAPAGGDATLNRLKAALAGDVVKGSKLDVPTAELLAGKEAKVSLSLPATLLESIQREAAKLGLGKAARRASVSAKLTGEGYSITPNGAQTAKLAPGAATSFSWMVHPTGDARKPLTADVDASLNGAGKPKTLSLLTLQSAIASLPNLAADAGDKAASMHLPSWLSHLNLRLLDIPGHEQLRLPVVGKVPSHNVVALVIIALALILLVNIAGGASRRRAAAESRRRRQALAYGGADDVHDDGHADAETHDEHGHGGALAAALGGAALGAIAAHEADVHAEHAHGHDDPGHDDHGHDAHGHDAHGHDAHGHDDHGHDDHGHDDHGHDAHGHDTGHGHGDDHGHDDHGHVTHVMNDAHGHDDGHGHDAQADNGHGHDAHGHADDHGGGHDDGHGGHGDDAHGHDAHGHDDHGHDDHGHAAPTDPHARQHEPA